MKTTILLIVAVLIADHVYGDQKSAKVKFGTLCSGNPSNDKRGCDRHGCGNFGAKRRTGTHKGLDIICDDGETVMAPFDVEIAGLAKPYDNGSAIDNGVKLKGEGLCFKLFYIEPVKSSGTVKKGQKVGTMLPMQEVYSGITSHVHVQMCDKSDPTKYF